ncbi:protein phosphatase 2C domain-containing protein [Botrimarina sp.]|uniref:protein phosphatase 2C domain-containing protein n=1 Tax=Botrimarina sp. TaxID=2795802 RepID=UPI0032EEE3F9
MATSQNSRLSERVQASILLLQEELQGAGALESAPAQLALDGLTLATATDVGSKRTNQDCALLFAPRHPSRLRWIAAVADGVSSSLNSEAASSLACHAAMVAIKRSYRLSSHDPKSTWSRIFDFRGTTRQEFFPEDNSLAPLSPVAIASRAIRGVGRCVLLRPDHFRPESVTESTWKRVLRDGRYLQTTLMVAWQVDDQLRIEGVGDGGFSVAISAGHDPLVYQPSSDRPVECLGPHRCPVDRAYRMNFDRWESLSVHTDGVTPGLATNPNLVSQSLRLSAALRSDRSRINPAHATLTWLLHNKPDLIDDNITLLLAERTSQCSTHRYHRAKHLASRIRHGR